MKLTKGILITTLFLLSMFMVQFVPNVSALEVEIDSYSESNESGISYYITDLHPSNDDNNQSARGQSFECTTTSKIIKAQFYLNKTGNPTGIAYVYLYAHTGTFGVNGVPTGSPLAKSDGFDVSTLTSSFALTEFTFTGAEQYLMQSNTIYCIVFVAPTSGIITMTAGNLNFIQVGSDGVSPSHSGNHIYYLDGDWRSASVGDTCFYIYGDNPGSHLTRNPTSTDGDNFILTTQQLQAIEYADDVCSNGYINKDNVNDAMKRLVENNILDEPIFTYSEDARSPFLSQLQELYGDELERYPTVEGRIWLLNMLWR